MKPLRKLLFTLIMVITLSRISAAQCPTGLAAGGANIVTNGDFSAGNSGFTNGYDFCNTAGCLGVDEGTYTVAPNPEFYNSAFEGADHTTGTGDFLIANGSTAPGTAVWCQTITFDPNSYYIISFWVSSLFAQNPASIQLYIAGSPYFGAITAPSTTNTWEEYNNTWQSGLNQSVEVCLYDANTNVDGNDFGLDDISIIKCECDLGVSAGPDKSMCLGDSVQLEGSGAVAYFWSPTNTLSCFTCSNPVASPDVTTSYTVTVSGPGGCTALDSALVTVFQHFDLNAGPDTTICENTPVQLHAEGAVSYTWVPSAGLTDPNISNPVATPSQSTTYYLSATDEHGCLQSDSTTIKIFPAFHDSVLITPHDTTICPGGFAEFHVTGAGNYMWQPQDHLTCDTCGTVVATPSASTTYTVTIADSNGCSTSSDTARVNIDLGCSHLVIPSAFSPNNDGRNDFFHALSQGVISLSLTLYNRWGELIFSTSDPDSTWDGKVNGKEQPAGVYIWVLKATLDDGTVINRNGNVTLVR